MGLCMEKTEITKESWSNHADMLWSIFCIAVIITQYKMLKPPCEQEADLKKGMKQGVGGSR